MMLQETVEHVASPAAEKFKAGEVIIEHVSNSGIDHPLIHLPKVFGIDMSVTKHVLMLWIVAAILFFGLTWIVRRYLKQDRLIPGRTTSLLEITIEFVRDSIAGPNLGDKWVLAWTPMLLTLFLFILTANAIGVIPVFDVLELLNSTLIHAGPESWFTRLPHGGVEVGGVLFGSRMEHGVRILKRRALQSEYGQGPSFALSANDEIALEKLIADAAADPELADLEPVGWYHSHTRSGVFLSEQDLDLYNRRFPQPWQIALVLRPTHQRSTL